MRRVLWSADPVEVNGARIRGFRVCAADCRNRRGRARSPQIACRCQRRRRKTGDRGPSRQQARRDARAGGSPRAVRARPRAKACSRPRDAAVLYRLAHRSRRRCRTRRDGCANCSPPKTPRAASPTRRFEPPPPPEIVRPDAIAARLPPDAVHQGLYAGGRSPALAADRGACHRRRRAGARPDHRSAQCRRDLPLGRGVRRDRDRHHGAAQPGGDRRAGEIRLRRARARAAGHGAESRARARRAESSAASW